MIFFSSGQSWKKHLPLGRFSLIRFVTEIQIPYFSYAFFFQSNDPYNKHAVPRSDFSKQIKRNNTKSQDQELSIKGERGLIFICFSFFLLEDAVMSCYRDHLFDINSLIKNIVKWVLLAEEEIWEYLKHIAVLQREFSWYIMQNSVQFSMNLYMNNKLCPGHRNLYS